MAEETIKRVLAKLPSGPFLLVIAFALYFALDYWIDLPPTGLEFYSETVTATPEKDAILFECEFHFMAHHPHKRSYEIGFPIYESGDHPHPESVEVAVDGKPIAHRVLAQGLVFWMPVVPGQDTISTIRYRLKAPTKKATYITRSANLWPKPIVSARFVLREGAASNYHEAGQSEVGFSDFRPKDNWRLSWGETP